MDELAEKFLPLIKEHSIAVVFGLAGLICLGYDLISLGQPQSLESGISNSSSQGTFIQARSQASLNTKQIFLKN